MFLGVVCAGIFPVCRYGVFVCLFSACVLYFAFVSYVPQFLN